MRCGCQQGAVTNWSSQEPSANRPIERPRSRMRMVPVENSKKSGLRLSDTEPRLLQACSRPPDGVYRQLMRASSLAPTRAAWLAWVHPVGDVSSDLSKVQSSIAYSVVLTGLMEKVGDQHIIHTV